MDDQNQPPQSNNEFSAEEQLVNYKKAIWTKTPFVVLLTLVALLIGVFIGTNYNKTQKALPENTNAKLTPTIRLSPTNTLPEVLPTSQLILDSWSTYENTYFGYSIRYPNDWSILASIGDCANGPNGISACLPKPDTDAGIIIDKDYEQKIYTYPIGNMTFNMPELIDYDGAYYLKGSAKKIIISGREATIYTLNDQTVITIAKDFPDNPNPNNSKIGITITFFYDDQGSEIYNDQLAIASSLIVK